MRQSSAITPSKACVQSLHPLLQRAFACSDIQLDEELARYRRQRALGKATYSPRPAAYRKAAKNLDLISVAPMPESSVHSEQVAPNAGSTLEPSSAGAALTFAIAALPDQADLSTANIFELKELAAQYAAQVASGAESALDGVSPDDYLESSEELLRSLAAEEAEVRAEQGFFQSLLTPLGMGAMLLLLLSSAMFGFLAMNPANVSRFFDGKETQTAANPLGAGVSTPNSTAGMTSAPQPNLASREFPDLSLQTLGSVEATPSVSGGTPALGQSGVSSVAGAQPANIGLSGKSDSIDSINGLVQSSEPVRTNTATLRVAEPLPQAGSSGYSAAPVSRSATLAPKVSAPIPSYKPSAQPYRSAPAQGSTQPAKLYTPPSVKFEPVPVKPEALSNMAPTPMTPQQPGQIREYVRELDYKVVTPYSSDRSLNEAQKKVPDAYLQNYPVGAKVQLGSFENEAAAKARVEELRQQGVQAEIYQPEGIKPEGIKPEPKR